MKGKKQMTIDDLSIVVKKGFQDVDRKMVTKDMLAGLATKDMLANLATKDMLTNLATKDMLAGLATKDMTKIMVDDLALMTQKGFQEIKHTMVTKDMLQLVVDDLDLIRADIRDIKISLGPLVRMVAALDTDMQHLMTRVARLEQKAGFGK